eukprot:399499-Heterocapsa_arctica.AAC.1
MDSAWTRMPDGLKEWAENSKTWLTSRPGSKNGPMGLEETARKSLLQTINRRDRPEGYEEVWEEKLKGC